MMRAQPVANSSTKLCFGIVQCLHVRVGISKVTMVLSHVDGAMILKRCYGVVYVWVSWLCGMMGEVFQRYITSDHAVDPHGNCRLCYFAFDTVVHLLTKNLFIVSNDYHASTCVFPVAHLLTTLLSCSSSLLCPL